jgi:citrate lyase beta subunit
MFWPQTDNKALIEAEAASVKQALIDLEDALNEDAGDEMIRQGAA